MRLNELRLRFPVLKNLERAVPEKSEISSSVTSIMVPTGFESTKDASISKKNYFLICEKKTNVPCYCRNNYWNNYCRGKITLLY